jgi:hypothetical protein
VWEVSRSMLASCEETNQGGGRWESGRGSGSGSGKKHPSARVEEANEVVATE